jgi:hypothetical protein
VIESLRAIHDEIRRGGELSDVGVGHIANNTFAERLERAIMASEKAKCNAFVAIGNGEVQCACLAVVASGSNASPKAKGNGRPDHERDHYCVP